MERGWAPVPVPAGTKNPGRAGWQDMRFASAQEARESFPEGMNIGLILGAASGGLVDVDLDCTEARMLGGSFLPHTPLTHGRASSPESHYWYVVDAEVATTKYQDPVRLEEIRQRRRQGLPPDPALAATLLELRSTGGQTIIPPSTHPSGETLSWGAEGLAEPRSVPLGRLATHVRALAAASLLSRYWPTQGSRHDASVALAGGLLRCGWTERNAAYFVTQVARAGGDEEASSRQKDVETTAKRLARGEDCQGFPTLAKIVGTLVVEAVRDWLNLHEEDDEPDEDDEEGLRNRRSVGQAIREGIPEPEWLLPGLLYAEKIHWWHGEPGGGKTLLMLGLIVKLINDGRTVMLVDEESGLETTADRLSRLGADPDKLDRHLLYYERPGLTMSPEDLDALFMAAKGYKPGLIVFDSVADLLDQAGLSEDENTEVTKWAKSVLEPLAREYGCAVVCIDHVTKSAEGRGGYARGAGAKKSKADAAWKVTPTKEFNATTIGTIKLEADKDRLGRLEPRHTFRIGGDGKGGIVCEAVDKVEREEGGKPPTLDDSAKSVLDFLALNVTREADAMTAGAIRKELKKGASSVDKALSTIVAAPVLGVAVTQNGSLKKYWYQGSESAGHVVVDFGEVE